jgi:HEAT repeat protein
MSLSELDDVPWSVVTHAYGSAADVPALIRCLASSDNVERSDAYEKLYSNIYHQGTVYEAAIHALPFLVELLRDPSTPDRGTLADLVASIISGRGYAEVHWSRPLINPFTRKPIAKPADLDDRIAKEQQVVHEIRRCGEEAVDVLLPFFRGPVPCTRLTVASALGLYPSRADALVPALWAAVADEEDQAVREAMEDSLKLLPSERPS